MGAGSMHHRRGSAPLVFMLLGFLLISNTIIYYPPRIVLYAWECSKVAWRNGVERK